MEERKAEQPLRSGWRPGFYMRPKHVGLVFCVSLVGCMVTFGAGFIVGMGYKASEQVSPYAVTKTQGGESVMQGRVSNAAWNDGEITFYDFLTKENTVPMVTNPESDSTEAGEPEFTAPAQTPVPASPVQRAAANGTAAQPVEAGDRTPQPAPVVVPPPVVPDPTDVAQERNVQTQTAAGARTSPRSTGGPVISTYSVQVASLLSAERAERLIEELTSKGYHAYVHPFEAPGQPLWYRVKVGKFADRATAHLAMQELGQPDAMITRD